MNITDVAQVYLMQNPEVSVTYDPTRDPWSIIEETELWVRKVRHTLRSTSYTTSPINLSLNVNTEIPDEITVECGNLERSEYLHESLRIKLREIINQHSFLDVREEDGWEFDGVKWVNGALSVVGCPVRNMDVNVNIKRLGEGFTLTAHRRLDGRSYDSHAVQISVIEENGVLKYNGPT